MVIITMFLATEKSNPAGATFKLKFVCFFNKPSPNFLENQSICLPTFFVPIATKKFKSNQCCTIELEWVIIEQGFLEDLRPGWKFDLKLI